MEQVTVKQQSSLNIAGKVKDYMMLIKFSLSFMVVFSAVISYLLAPKVVEFDWLHVTLKYTEDRDPVISGLRRISTPGRRQYVTASELPRVQGGMGTAILTTSRGVMTAYEARRQNVGGEVLAHIW